MRRRPNRAIIPEKFIRHNLIAIEEIDKSTEEDNKISLAAQNKVIMQTRTLTVAHAHKHSHAHAKHR